MKYLCNYHCDNSDYNFKNCDNTGLGRIKYEEDSLLKETLKEFFENYFPALEVESKNSNLKNGLAVSYYGFSNIGTIIHRCKYENGGDYPDFLVDKFVQAVKKNYRDEKLDLIVYVPPTVSGTLVRNFAIKVGQKLNIPVSQNLIKVKATQPQKVFQNS